MDIRGHAILVDYFVPAIQSGISICPNKSVKFMIDIYMYLT